MIKVGCRNDGGGAQVYFGLDARSMHSRLCRDDVSQIK